MHKHYSKARKSCQFHFHTYSPEYISAMIESTLHLCGKFSEKLRSSEKNQVKLLRGAFSCALSAIENACSLYNGEGGIIDHEKAIIKIRKVLKEWIAHKDVIGGSVFGSTVQSYFTRSNLSWKGKEELKVIKSLGVHYNSERMT